MSADPTMAQIMAMTSEERRAFLAARVPQPAPAPKKAKKPSRWGQRAAQPKAPRPAATTPATSTTTPKTSAKPRPATPSEWQDLTGELLEAREIVRVPGSLGGSELVLTFKAFERLPPYIALHWEKPDPTTGEMKRTRGKTLACQLADVATMAEAWASAAAEVARMPAPQHDVEMPDDVGP